jgi:hypothetical protein
VAVSAALTENRTLIFLGLSANDGIGNEGAEMVASALRRNTQIGKRQFTTPDISRLVEAPTFYHDVMTLHLTDTGDWTRQSGRRSPESVFVGQQNIPICAPPRNLWAGLAMEGIYEGMRKLIEGEWDARCCSHLDCRFTMLAWTIE